MRTRTPLPPRAPALYPAIVARMNRLHVQALKLARHRHDAEDLVQATVLRAIEYSGTFAPGTNLGAWLTVMMRRIWFSERNRPYRRRRGDVDPTMLEIAVDGGQVEHVLLQETARAIAALPRAPRKALLDAAAELTMEEAAAAAGIAAGTAKSRLHRARTALAEVAS